jgi:Tfp pilus assembly protein PilF
MPDGQIWWEASMLRRTLFCTFLVISITAGAQVVTIHIPAGSPEEKALEAVSAENDGQKRIAMLQDFLQKFSASPETVVYGQWQLAQQYLDQGDAAKALEYGQKAVAGQPNNMDILVFLAGAAQKAKATDVIMECADKGGKAFNGIANRAKPEGMDPEDFALRTKQAQDPVRPSYEFLEATALNALVGEQNNGKRMVYIERYLGAFPNSRFQEQVTQLAVASLAEMKDSRRLNSFAEKALAANPTSVSTLVVLAEAFAENSEAGATARAEGYARKALESAASQKPTEANQLELYTGLAHSALGYALMKQEKSAAAIPELKAACSMLKDHSDAYSSALYRLSFAYAKTPGKLGDAKAALTELVAIPGPYQQPARDLLGKVQAAANAKAPTKKSR